MSLTNRQRNFLEQFARLQEGSPVSPPTFRQLADATDVSGLQGVYDMVNRLKAHGWLRGERRWLRLTRVTERALGLWPGDREVMVALVVALSHALREASPEHPVLRWAESILGFAPEAPRSLSSVLAR